MSWVRVGEPAAQAAGAEVVLIGVPKPGLFISDSPVYQRLADEFGLPYLDEALADIYHRQHQLIQL